MRFIRPILICLAIVAALAVLIVIAAFSPVVQTWAVERALAAHPGVHASVGSAWLGFSSVELNDVRLEFDGAVLKLPSLNASLPLKSAWFDRKFAVQQLVAKGWTLDLTGRAAPNTETTRAAAEPPSNDGAAPATSSESTPPALPAGNPSREAARVVREFLRARALPCDVSLSGVDLDGDVLIAATPGKEPVRVHVTITGGGMSAGHPGEFTVDATATTADPNAPASSGLAHGQLIVAMASPRTFSRIEFKGSASVDGGWFPKDLEVSAGIAAGTATSDETYSVDLHLGDRHLGVVTAHLSKDGRQLSGPWKIDLRESDFAGIDSTKRLPAMTASGDGQFDADSKFATVHVAGQLNTATAKPGAVVPSLNRFGAVTLTGGFDFARSGRSVRVNRLDAALAGIRPIANVHLLQPFTLNEQTRGVAMVDPNADWLTGSVQRLPLAWLPLTMGGLSFTQGEATGDFVVSAANGGFAVRSKAPLVATGVSVENSGTLLGRELDLSLELSAESTPRGWQVQGAPLTVSRAGRTLGSVEFAVAPAAAAGGRPTIACKWNADLETLASGSTFQNTGWLKGRSASGDFSATLGRSMAGKGKINFVGHDPTHVLSASLDGFIDAAGGGELRGPVKISFGPNVSELEVAGGWTKTKAGRRLDLAVNGVNVALEHLGLLAASVSAASGVALPVTLGAGTGGPQAPPRGRDERPFWGDWTGRADFSIYQLRLGDHDLNEVAAGLVIDHGSVRLEGGRGKYIPARPPATGKARPEAREEDHPTLVTLDGTIAFDAAAGIPYSIKANASADAFDAEKIFGAAKRGQDPVFEGRFSATETVTGNGLNLADLVDRRQEELHFTSNGGIVRFLKTTVSGSLPDDPTPVRDALANAGSVVVGTIMGIRPSTIDPGRKNVSKETEAVLSVTYKTAELGYDQFTVTAVRRADRMIDLPQIELSGPDLHLAGSGQIGFVAGRPLSAQPLSLELQLGARGHLAEFLSTARLLGTGKDGQGFSPLAQSMRFGGTLEQIDISPWHDLLAKAAATPAPARGNKGN